jgi:hypothetical protein
VRKESALVVEKGKKNRLARREEGTHLIVGITAVVSEELRRDGGHVSLGAESGDV